METLLCDDSNQYIHIFDTTNLLDATFACDDEEIRTCIVQPCPNRYKQPTISFGTTKPEDITVVTLDAYEKELANRYVVVVKHQEPFCGIKKRIESHIDINNPEAELPNFELPLDITIRPPQLLIEHTPITALTGTTLAGTSYVTHLSEVSEAADDHLSISARIPRRSSKDHESGSEKDIEDLLDPDQSFYSAISNVTVVQPVILILIEEDDEIDFVLDAFWP